MVTAKAAVRQKSRTASMLVSGEAARPRVIRCSMVEPEKRSMTSSKTLATRSFTCWSSRVRLHDDSISKEPKSP